MIIHAYTLVKDEELMITFYLNHYANLADKIIIYDNDSTDQTVEIANSYSKVEIRRFEMNGWDDTAITNLYNECWKESRGKADWVIMCSADEILYHPNLRSYLENRKRKGITIPRTKGFSMLAEDESLYDRLHEFKDRQIYDLIKTGTYWERDNKFMVFNPEIEINFDNGCHTAKPIGNVKYDIFPALKNLHYSLRGLKGSLDKNKMYRERVSQINKDLHLGFHRMDDGYFIETNYRPVKQKLKKVI